MPSVNLIQHVGIIQKVDTDLITNPHNWTTVHYSEQLCFTQV